MSEKAKTITIAIMTAIIVALASTIAVFMTKNSSKTSEQNAAQTQGQEKEQSSEIEKTSAYDKLPTTKIDTGNIKLEFGKQYRNVAAEKDYLLSGENEDSCPRIIFKDDGTFFFYENWYLNGFVEYTGTFTVDANRVICNLERVHACVCEQENNSSIEERKDVKENDYLTQVIFTYKDGSLIIDNEVYLTKKGEVFEDKE